MRLDRDDLSALIGENTRDCHFCLPEKVLRSTFDRLCFGRPQAAANYHHKMLSVSSLRKSTVATILLVKRQLAPPRLKHLGSKQSVPGEAGRCRRRYGCKMLPRPLPRTIFA